MGRRDALGGLGVWLGRRMKREESGRETLKRTKENKGKVTNNDYHRPRFSSSFSTRPKLGGRERSIITRASLPLFPKKKQGEGEEQDRKEEKRNGGGG